MGLLISVVWLVDPSSFIFLLGNRDYIVLVPWCFVVVERHEMGSLLLRDVSCMRKWIEMFFSRSQVTVLTNCLEGCHNSDSARCYARR